MRRLFLLFCLFLQCNGYMKTSSSTHCSSTHLNLFFDRRTSPSNDLKKLILLVENADKGLDKSNQKEVVLMMETIVNKSRNSRESKIDKKKLEGTWDLMYTTEKETLFFYKNGLFGAKCTAIRQSIDFDNSLINNLIVFDKGREFSVCGNINTGKDQPARTNFKFASASLKLSDNFKLNVPPVGEGWFDTLYVDSSYRISYDVRGDWLLSKRNKDLAWKLR